MADQSPGERLLELRLVGRDAELRTMALADSRSRIEGFKPKRRSFLPRDLAPIDIAGMPLRCQHCGYEQFAEREAQLHTATLTFLNLEWLGKTADLYICGRCGFVHWFLRGVGEV